MKRARRSRPWYERAVAKQANGKFRSVPVMIVLAVAAAAACVWALSLRSENERLRTAAALPRTPAAAPEGNATPLTPAPTPTPPAPTPPDTPSAAPGPNRLTDDDRAAMRTKLPATATSESRVWFSVSSDPEAQALAADVEQVFQQAGWNVVSRPSLFPVQTGIFFFTADESPTSSVEDALQALQVVGFAPTVGLGYRAFYEERRLADPNWRGVELAPDQSFVIVIGPR